MDMDLGSSGLCFERYLRIRVVVDLSKPLKRAMGLVVNPKEASITMFFVYEKLPLMCLNSGLIGHVVRECPLFLTEVSTSQTITWKYSSWFDA